MSSSIKWDEDKELSEWKLVATEKQKIYHLFFKNRRWERYDKAELSYLQAKIGYIFFGPPIVTQETAIPDFYNTYTNAQKKKIADILTAIQKITKNLTSAVVGFMFLIAMINKEYAEFPVFRVLTKKHADKTEDYEIIDSFGYIYKSWEKFLATNILPYGVYCYPKNSFYSCKADGEIDIDFSLFTRGYSILSGIASRVRSRGRGSSVDLRFIPCKSVIKGIVGENQNYWITVTTASGSVDVYAVHSTYSLALSSQRIQNIPQLVVQALDYGYIKINWYSIINNIENIVQNSSLISSRHIAEVISSALFFCNVVLSPELAKQIIKEIKNNKKYKASIFLNHMQNSVLEKSLMINGESISFLRSMPLKFLCNRKALMDEIIEKHFKKEFMIPDQYGNYYLLGNLLENLGSSRDTKKYADIITNYCLVLEETIRKCDNCSLIIEGNRKLIETLHSKANNIMVEERETEFHKIEKQNIISEGKEDNELSFSFNENESSILSKELSPNYNMESKHHLRTNSFFSNIQESKKSTPKNINPKEVYLSPGQVNDLQGLTKNTTRNSNQELSVTPTNFRSFNEHLAEKSLSAQSNQSQTKSKFDSNTSDTLLNKNISSPMSGLSDLDENINTPESKMYNKKCIIDELHLKKHQQSRKGWAPVRKVDLEAKSPLSENLNKEEVQSGKFEIFIRPVIENEKLEPLDYYNKFVEDEFKTSKPTVHCDEGEENSWQFINEKETLGVKLIKIDIRARDKDKEWVGVTYY